MTKIGYLRVSTLEQCADRQIDGLQELCDELHVEMLSAISRRRPVYEHVMQRLQAGDTFVVWDLDRAFRSVIDAVTVAEHLRSRGIQFQIANLQIDTTTPSGMLVYTVMSAFAEFERRLMVQRTKEGLAAARRRGTRLGRPPKLNPDQLADVRRRLSSSGTTIAMLSTELGMARWSLSRAMKRDMD
jgi:DNA invertase Pin-like site-specific DNA recombinase